MKQKFLWGTILFLSMSLFIFSSCSSDDDDDNPAKPTVQILELGSGHDSPNDKTAVIGADAHIEAVILAEGLIKEIKVEVHQEGGNYEFSKVYTDTKYVGKKDPTFHEHLDIPSDASAGKYHLHLTVVDQFGQTATAESDLTLKEAEVSITIDGFKFGAGHDFPDNKIGYIGTAPVVEASSIKAVDGIEKVYVMMHSEGEGEQFKIEATFPFTGETELVDFHKHVSIPDNAPAGDYHLHIKVYDKKGKSVEKSMDVEIKKAGITISGLEIGNNNSAVASNIHTEFNVTATDPLKSIRVRIYKEETPTTYVFNKTYDDKFTTGDVKTYNFHEHLNATGATAGKYIIEFRVNDNKNASKTIKETLNITGA